MPRLTIQQTNFTAGEITPRIYGRTDIEKYGNAAKEMTNAHPVIHGGSKRRAGTRYAQPAKLGSASTSRMIDFVVSRDLSFALEFGDLYVRIYTPSGVYTGIELVSPYTAAQVAALDYTQGADTMFLFHPDVAPQRLRRFSSTVFDLSPAPFTVYPFDEVGYRPATTMTLSATTGTVTATAGAAIFLVSDVGRNLISSIGAGAITAYISTTQVTVSITTGFASTALASGAWYLDVSPQAFCTASAVGPVGSVVTLYGALTRAATLTLSATSGSITVTASAGIFTSADTGKVLYADLGFMTLTYSSATTCTGTAGTGITFSTTTYASGAWAITGNAFRSTDVGKYVEMNSGLLLITAYTDATKVSATVQKVLTSLTAVPPLAWQIEDSMWSATFGYPSTGTLFQQRLWCGNSAKYPQTVWGSVTGEYLNFQKGTDDTDACIFQIASDTSNPISYMSAQTDLIVHTYGGEFIMTGGTDTAITPSNIEIKPQTYHGSKGVRPLTVGKESLFVQRAGRKLRAMSYQLSIDGYTAPDLTALAEHITYSGIVSIAYQQEPDGIVWAVLADGTLLSCTLDRDQNVVGWAKHYTQGAFESVCTIPNGTFDQVWFIVRRTVNGATVRYVEYLDSDFAPALPGAASTSYPPITQPTVYGCTVDAGLVIDNAAGQTVLTGLSHLEGCTVDAVSDGSYMGTFVVAGGAITLPRAAYRTLVGLHFQSRTGLLTPEVGAGDGTAQGNSMRTGEITLRFLNTVGADVLDGDGRAQEVPWRSFGALVLDQPPPVFSGLMRIEMLGWERGRSELEIVQDAPMPMHLLSVIRKFTVNS